MCHVSGAEEAGWKLETVFLCFFHDLLKIVKDSEDNNRITEDHKVFKCTRDFTQEAKQTKHLAEVQLL